MVIISEDLRYSPEDNFTRNAQDINSFNEFQNWLHFKKLVPLLPGANKLAPFAPLLQQPCVGIDVLHLVLVFRVALLVQGQLYDCSKVAVK